MKPTDLDRLYTALCEALGRVGERRASLLLATLALDLMARGDEDVVQSAIDRAERLCDEAPWSTADDSYCRGRLTARPCAPSP